MTPSLVATGRFIRSSREALLTTTYASRQKLGVGSKLDLNGTKLTVVGLVRAPLGGQTADVYVSLPRLQSLAAQKRLVNVVLVRADSGADVGAVQPNIERTFPRAQVASAKDVADRISGSLVDASNLSHRLGVALAVLAALTAFLIALAADARVGRQARARDRHAEGARLDATARRPPDRRRVARAGACRRAARRRARVASRLRRRRVRADAVGDVDDRRRRRFFGLGSSRAHGDRPGLADGARAA